MKSESCKGCEFLGEYKDGGWFCKNSTKAYEAGTVTLNSSPGLFRIKKLEDVHCNVYSKKKKTPRLV